MGVVSPGDKAAQKGLLFAATPASDFVCGTLQLASGMHLQVFTTGRGTPYGLAIAPVIKVSTRNALTEQWPDLIDINAGRIATGEASIEEVGWEIFRLIVDVASGRKQTWAEYWGLENALCLFNPAPVT
jgi:galactarate dehydratase